MLLAMPLFMPMPKATQQTMNLLITKIHGVGVLPRLAKRVTVTAPFCGLQQAKWSYRSSQ
jgi:hypothetical protein